MVEDRNRPGKFRDPVTGKERLGIDPGHVDPVSGKPLDDPNAGVPHVHGYPEEGPKARRIVDTESGNPHSPFTQENDDE